MPIEQRVISGNKIGVRNLSTGNGAKAPAAPEPVKGGGKKKLVLILAAVLVVAGGAAYYVLGMGMGAGAGDGAAGEPSAPQPGTVLAVEPVSINLADGHYLRLGLGLQLVQGAETVDPSKALDVAIPLFTGHTVAEVSDPATRDALKAELVTALGEAYEGEVMDVYLTNFVTQ